MRGGVDEHRRVVADALGRREWSAKRSRSEREADHERRSADMCKKCLLSVSLVNPTRIVGSDPNPVVTRR